MLLCWVSDVWLSSALVGCCSCNCRHSKKQSVCCFEVHTGGTPAAELTKKRLDSKLVHITITRICETWYLQIYTKIF